MSGIEITLLVALGVVLGLDVLLLLALKRKRQRQWLMQQINRQANRYSHHV